MRDPGGKQTGPNGLAGARLASWEVLDVKRRLGFWDVLWPAAGAGVVVAATLVAWHYRAQDGPAELLARKAEKIDLVEGMLFDLASASEAEKSAVMSATEQEAQEHA